MSARTANLAHAGFSVDWSPFYPGKVAASSGEHFGLAGAGAIEIFDVKDDGLVLCRRMATAAGQFGLAWSEAHPDQLVSSGADGRLRLFDLRAESGLPVAVLRHCDGQAVNSASWSPVERGAFCGAGADGRLTVWAADRNEPVVCLEARGRSPAVAQADASDLWAAEWHPSTGPVLADAGVTGCVTVWDLRAPSRSPAASTPVGEELLDVSWCRYQPATVAAASTGGDVQIWDMRRAAAPLASLRGHSMAVLAVAFSPWDSDDVVSCSYDTRTCLWDAGPATASSLQQQWHSHSEFARDVSWSPLARGTAASVGWDGILAVIRPGSGSKPPG